MPSKNFVDPLEHCRFDINRPPPPSVPVYVIGDVTICTTGNLTTILAQPKVGKTAFFDAMIAATLREDGVTCDTFSIVSQNREGFALVHFDTEQTQQDHWKVVARAMRRAKLTQQPEWLRSYCVTAGNPIALWLTIQAQIATLRKEFGGIHSVLIDGYADLVMDVNDAKESAKVITDLQKLAIDNACPIAGVLHYNPGSEKGRGHLGSQLERRAESNIALTKLGGMVEIWSDKQRGAPIIKGQGPSFTWDKDMMMHVSTASRCATQQKAALDEAREQAKKLFNGDAQLRYGALKMAIAAQLDKSESTSERKIKEWGRLGIIRKNSADLWERCT